MSTARHHAEWLWQVEASGPFLSMPVLLRVFPQGLDQRDPAKAARLREAYEDWLERGPKQPAVHHGWIRHVLTQLLEYPPEFLVEGQAIPPGMEAVMANFGETLRPAFVLKHRDAGKKPPLLIEHYAPDQDLEKPVAGKLWKASPGMRMMELLHAADVPLGLVTNGEQWMLVSAPRGETTGFASWYADLWMEEPITLRAFHSLLHLRRFLGVAEPETLAELYAESSKDQQEVTDQLGHQVRCAVEMLVQAFDRIDAASGRKLLAGVSEKTLYDSALTVMMRLVFLFSAEERKLIAVADPKLYNEFYAASTVSAQLRERADQHGEEVLERRQDAWCRLLATFRAVHGGVEHEALRLPAYGGTLFDPDRYPFLEGRAAGTQWQTTAAKPLPINNRVVLHLLEALQVLRVKVPGGGPAEARRLSFRALDIEQIGHVYEGLLDHTAKRAPETILGLAGAKGEEPEIPLSKLEELAGVTPDQAEAHPQTAEPFLLAAERPGNVIPLPTGRPTASYAPPEKLIEFLQEETGRSAKAITKALMDLSHVDEDRLLIACGNDRRLLDRVWNFAALLRPDTFGFPIVIPTGSVYVTAGSDRRSTGTHYTPRSLTEPIVLHTLEPLVYVGPAEGKPKEQWQLKSPKEILSLKVCDMTMGSGAFLVQTCRYLAERLVEAWETEEEKYKGQTLNAKVSPEFGVAADSTSAFSLQPSAFPPSLQPLALHAATPSTGNPSELLLPNDPAERIMMARRVIADRCLYGVDINPMAVEMAKLSLWLITLQRDRPFTFLDHALKCGDSLLGVSRVKQIENFTLRKAEGEYAEMTFATANLMRNVEAASAKRRALEDLPSNDHTQIETKNRLHAEAEAATAKVKALADALIAFELRGLDGDAYEEQRAEEAEKVQLMMKQADDAPVNSQKPTIDQLSAYACEQLHGRRPFHWSVEFPEVMARGGFDAFVGNPPFMGGKKITGPLGTDYRRYLVEHLAEGMRGNADLCAYFFLRVGILLRPDGLFGLLATNTIAQGDTREIGLEVLLKAGGTIIRAIPSRAWPGAATLEVAHVWVFSGKWAGDCLLNDQKVRFITSLLTAGSGMSVEAHALDANRGKAFVGCYVLGLGFTLTPTEAAELARRDSKNREVTFPYLNGEDLNTHPEQLPSRWIINFVDWPLRPEQGEERNASRRYALDFPDCLALVETRVKPQRAEASKFARKEWWLYQNDRPNLRRAIAGLTRVLVFAQTSKTKYPVFVPNGWVYDQKTIVIATEDYAVFSLLCSHHHYTWVHERGLSLRTDAVYTPSDCFETFPFPESFAELANIGTRYHEIRRQIMQTRQEGLTKTYNRFHDRGEQSADIARLRALHVEMDQAVAAAYGWSDLDLGHGFHATKQGERYTLSEPARRTVLDRLLQLNHQRYAEEVKAGLHEKGAKKGKTKKKPVVGTASAQPNLLPEPQIDFLEESSQ